MSDPKTERLDLDSPEAKKERQQALQHAKAATEISDALKEGRLPTTGQVTDAIDRLESSEVIHDASQGMSITGQVTMADAERAIHTVRDYVAEKNDEDHLQKAILHSHQAAEEIKKQGIPDKVQSKVFGAVDDDKSALELSQQATDHAIQVGKLLFTSEEYRDLLRELYFVLRDTFARAVPGDTSTIQKNLDQAAYVGQNVIGIEKPIVTDQHLQKQENDPHETEQRQKGAALAQKAKETGDVKGTVAQQAAPPREEMKDNLKKTAMETIDKEGSNLTENKDIKETGKEYKDKAQHTLTHFELTEENRRQLADRFRNILRLLEGNPTWRQSVNDLIELITTINQRHVNVLQATQSEIQETAAMEHVKEARRHIRLLFEQLAGGRSLQPLLDQLNGLWEQMQQDQCARDYLKEVRHFVERCLEKPTYMEEKSNKDQLDHLINKGQSVLVKPYQARLNTISHEVDEYLRAVVEDKSNQRLAKDVETLFSNAMLGPDGKLTAKPELAHDLALLIRRVFRMMRFLPLPRVETYQDDMDLVLDDIVLYCGELLPNQISIHTDTDINVESTDGKPNIHNTIHVTIEKIHGEARDMLFDYHRKKFPEMEDCGVLTASFMEGDGMRLDLVFVTPKESDPEQNVKLAHVNTDFKNLNISFKETSHNTLYTVISPIVNSVARRQVDKMVSDTIRSFFQSLDQQIGSIKESSMQGIKMSGGGGGQEEQRHEQSPTTGADPHGRREIPTWSSPAYSV